MDPPATTKNRATNPQMTPLKRVEPVAKPASIKEAIDDDSKPRKPRKPGPVVIAVFLIIWFSSALVGTKIINNFIRRNLFPILESWDAPNMEQQKLWVTAKLEKQASWEAAKVEQQVSKSFVPDGAEVVEPHADHAVKEAFSPSVASSRIDTANDMSSFVIEGEPVLPVDPVHQAATGETTLYVVESIVASNQDIMELFQECRQSVLESNDVVERAVVEPSPEEATVAQESDSSFEREIVHDVISVEQGAVASKQEPATTDFAASSVEEMESDPFLSRGEQGNVESYQHETPIDLASASHDGKMESDSVASKWEHITVESSRQSKMEDLQDNKMKPNGGKLTEESVKQSVPHSIQEDQLCEHSDNDSWKQDKAHATHDDSCMSSTGGQGLLNSSMCWALILVASLVRFARRSFRMHSCRRPMSQVESFKEVMCDLCPRLERCGYQHFFSGGRHFEFSTVNYETLTENDLRLILQAFGRDPWYRSSKADLIEQVGEEYSRFLWDLSHSDVQKILGYMSGHVVHGVCKERLIEEAVNTGF